MKVLFTTDGSESAERSIGWFSRLPRAHGVACEVMTVVTRPAFGMMPNDVYDELIRLGRDQASQWFQQSATILKDSGINAVEVVRVGQPADEITRYAKESQSDLIVMGARGSSQLTRLLIGSTTEAVVNHAPCSVLIVRNASQPVIEQPCVTLATDGSDVEEQIVTQIELLGLPKHSKLQLLSVVEDLYLLSPDSKSGAFITRAMGESLERLAKKLEPVSDNIEQVVLEGTHVGNSILEYIKTHPADLILIADKGRSAIARFFLGTVSRYVLHHATCSVLVAKKKLK